MRYVRYVRSRLDPTPSPRAIPSAARRLRCPADGKASGSATWIWHVGSLATLTGGPRLQVRTYALDARTGKLVWSFPDGKYTPVVAEPGRLFLIGYGTVYGMVPR